MEERMVEVALAAVAAVATLAAAVVVVRLVKDKIMMMIVIVIVEYVNVHNRNFFVQSNVHPVWNKRRKKLFGLFGLC